MNKIELLGAIIGDIVGSRFEWDNIKTKNFSLFDKSCFFTDDSVMTIAIAKAIVDCSNDYSNLSEIATSRMIEFGRKYPDRGYGNHFFQWLNAQNPKPYNSFGNGSAMRVSACGLVAKSVDEAKDLSKKVTEISHNHPEGVKGAESVAVAIYLAKEGFSKEYIKKYINENYYKINFTLNQIRNIYSFEESCQGTVPPALEAFFESLNFEDAIRNAISIGGDSDTLAAITGSVAAAYYGIEKEIKNQALGFLDSPLKQAIEEFENLFDNK